MASNTVFQPLLTSQDQEGLGDSGQLLYNKL